MGRSDEGQNAPMRPVPTSQSPQAVWLPAGPQRVSSRCQNKKVTLGGQCDVPSNRTPSWGCCRVKHALPHGRFSFLPLTADCSGASADRSPPADLKRKKLSGFAGAGGKGKGSKARTNLPPPMKSRLYLPSRLPAFCISDTRTLPLASRRC